MLFSCTCQVNFKANCTSQQCKNINGENVVPLHLSPIYRLVTRYWQMNGQTLKVNKQGTHTINKYKQTNYESLSMKARLG